MKHILLPTDFSENSQHAAIYALKLFKNMSCKFYFLHTYTPAIYTYNYQISAGVIGQNIVQAAINNAEERLHEFALSVMNMHGNNIEFETLLRLDTLSGAIKTLSKDLNIDVVVMGTKGATGSSDVIFGTNTIHVINGRSCPVLAVPENYNYNGLNTVFFPTDLNVEYTEKHLNLLNVVAKLHQSNIRFLHITFRGLKSMQKKHKASLETVFKEHKYSFKIIDDKDIADAVFDFQKENETDLLVMINNKHLFFENLFFRPTISKIAMHLETPFLVIPA